MGADMYIINQSYVGTECVFEFAMCMTCREEMNAKLSEQSRVAMFDFIHDHAHMDARIERLGTESDTEAYLETCLTCQRDRKEAAGFTSGAMFTGQSLIKGPFPMIICDQCELKLAETVSEQTRDVWEKFVADNFPAPPSDIKLPRRRKPVVL